MDTAVSNEKMVTPGESRPVKAVEVGNKSGRPSDTELVPGGSQALFSFEFPSREGNHSTPSVTRGIFHKDDVLDEERRTVVFRMALNRDLADVPSDQHPKRVEEFIINALKPHLEANLRGHLRVPVWNMAERELVEDRKKGDHDLPSSGRERPDYDQIATKGKVTAEYESSMQSMARSGVFNRPLVVTSANPGGKGVSTECQNLSLNFPECAPIRERAQNFYRDGHSAVILPFANEPFAAHINARYALELAGSNLVCVSAGSCPLSEERVRAELAGSEAVLLSQREILSCINWREVSKLCALPLESGAHGNELPKGTKGLTLLAGLLYACATERTQKWVHFHDTDIVNPYHYQALELLALPDVISPRTSESWRAAYIAKTGPGRNNQIQTSMANALADDTVYKEHTRHLARMLSTLIWPLTGERAAKGSDLYNMPWTTGMSIETQFNTYFTGLQTQDNNTSIAQVLNPVAKREDRPVEETREWAMMGSCAQWLKAVLHHVNETSTFPHEFSLNSIRDFNRHYGGRYMTGMFQSSIHEHQVPRVGAWDFMLPSIAQLEKAGLVDWERMLDLKPMNR